MKFNEMAEFAKLMTGLGMLYGKPMNEPLIDIYWHTLLSFDFKSIKEALQAHVKNPDTGQFLPKPADVVRYLEGSSESQALRAWSVVISTVRAVGRYESVVFDDPIIHRVISDMGGWIRLCEISEKDLSYRAHEFEKRYLGHLIHPLGEYPQKLIGLIESYNNSQGHPIESPLLIGDAEKARQTYEKGNEYHTTGSTRMKLENLSMNYWKNLMPNKLSLELTEKVA